jgi:hypothetical protein
MLNKQGVTENFGTFSEIVKRNADSNFDRMTWGNLMIHIYGNPGEREVDVFG